ncbi:MAG: glycosyltransferase [Actinobacteria bacterium]|nr:glycosyltransferase [Actinomycetota bacterium]
MRILFVTIPGHGHFYPMVPLVRACSDLGHELKVASTASFAPTIEEAGFSAVTIGPDWHQSRPGEVIDDLPPTGSGRTQAVGRFFSSIAPRQGIPDLMDSFSSWRPDVVVLDPVDPTGLLAAMASDIPFATPMYHVPMDGIGGLHPSAEAETAAEARRVQVSNELREVAGIPPKAFPLNDEIATYLLFDMVPPSFAPLSSRLKWRTAHTMRPDMYPIGGEAPWDGNKERPRVLLTMGTVFHGAHDVLLETARGLTKGGWEVVATVPDGVELPVEIRAERWVALDAALDECDLLVTHGGWGSVMAAFHHGVPMLLLPQGADQPRQALRVRSVGAGLYILPGELSAESVFSAAQSILGDDLFRRNSERIKDEITVMPGPREVVSLLEKLGKEKRPIVGPPLEFTAPTGAR